MYYVTKREKCPECDGGVTNHPDWIAYWGSHFPDIKAPRETARWFCKRGHHTLPPEEIKCLECNGTGIVESEVSLSEALADLGFDLSLVG